MTAFETVLKNHKECVVYYHQTARTHLSTVATLITVREMVKQSGASLKFHAVDSITEFEDSAESDWSKVYCYLDAKEEGNVLIYSHYDEEHVYGVANVGYTNAFPSDDGKIISQLEQHNEVPLGDLWLMVSGNPDSKLIKALISDRLIRFYNTRVGLIDNLLEHAHSNIFSIYIHVLDYCKRHRLKIHAPKPKTQSSHKIKKKGVVVTINQTDTFDDTYLKYGFQRHPDAGYLINFWNDGVLQVLSSEEPEFKHVDLANVYDLIIEELQHKLEKKIIPLSTIKWVLRDAQNPLVELDFMVFLNQKPNVYYGTRGTVQHILHQKEKYEVDYQDFTEEMWKELDTIGLSLYDVLQLTTQKSPDALTLTGLIFYGKQQRPNQQHKLFSIEKGVKLSSIFRHKIVRLLNKMNPEPDIINEEEINEAKKKKIETKVMRDEVFQHLEKKFTGWRKNYCLVLGIIQLEDGTPLLIIKNTSRKNNQKSILNELWELISSIRKLYRISPKFILSDNLNLKISQGHQS